MKDVRYIIGDNLAMLRKANKLTQQDLAEKLNYSDKTVSKWEKGDNLPLLEVLIELSKFYKCTLDYLITEHSETDMLTPYPLKNINYYKNKKHLLISMITSTCIWFIAILIFVILKLTINKNIWIIFAWSTPINILVLAIFNIFWGKKKYWVYIESFFIWTLLICFYLQFLKYNLWPLFVIGLPVQLIILLFYMLVKNYNKMRN